MKISVIVPVYNARPFLARCIRSVKEQTYRDWECLVIDDASTDGSVDEIMRLGWADDRFRIFLARENGGAGATRNWGLDEARGDAVFFLDADDWIDPEILTSLTWYAYASHAARIVSPALVHRETQERPERRWGIKPPGLHGPDSPYLFSDYSCDPGHVTGSLYIPAMISGPLRFAGCRIFEDMIFNMELIFSGASTFITDEYLYHYRRHAGSLVSQPFTQEDADGALAAFEAAADRQCPPAEVYMRCRRFLENTIKSKLG